MNFKYFYLISFVILIILNSSLSYSFDNKKCKKAISYGEKKYDKTIEDSLELYTYHYTRVFNNYYVLNQLTEKKCPMLMGVYSELSKEGIYNTILSKLPTNRFVEESGLKQCLLSHFNEKHTAEALSPIKDILDILTKRFFKHFEDTKNTNTNLSKKNNLKDLEQLDLYCKSYYLKMYKSKNGLERHAKKIDVIEKKAIYELKKNNLNIIKHCILNNCDFE